MVEGKTKIIKDLGDGTVIIKTKDSLTGDDAAKKEFIHGISIHKTNQTVSVFNLLNKSGIKTSFIDKVSDNEIICHSCKMIPLELVIRRYAWGSFLKRQPEYVSKDLSPFRFDKLKTDFFHKLTVIVPPNSDSVMQIFEDEAREKYLVNNKWKEGVYTDPYINIKDSTWKLYPAKVPFNEKNCLMTIDPVLSKEETDLVINEIMIPCFSIIEKAWSKVLTKDGPVSLVDLKIEIGRSKKDNTLMISDVIDNDSWRVWPGGNPKKQLDKQAFRDGEDLSKVSSNYELVSKLCSQF